MKIKDHEPRDKKEFVILDKTHLFIPYAVQHVMGIGRPYGLESRVSFEIIGSTPVIFSDPKHRVGNLLHRQKMSFKRDSRILKKFGTKFTVHFLEEVNGIKFWELKTLV